QHKVISLHDNAPSHTAKLVKETIEAFSWEILSHAAYSPDLAPSDYYLFASMRHAFAEQRFSSYENVRKWLDDWFASKEQQFFSRGIHKLSDVWEKCIASDGQYL
ncbi:Histone-lysine N-methyltransferase SETMAR, partial [Harpegnathos saltator]